MEAKSTHIEAMTLAEELLADIELSRISLTNAALKAARLARLTNDLDLETLFSYEAGGYPTHEGSVPYNAFQLGTVAGRSSWWTNPKTKQKKQVMYTESIAQLEEEIETGKVALSAAIDREVSLATANPNQYLSPPSGNTWERSGIRSSISTAAKKLASRKSFIHQYARRKYYELKLSGITEDILIRLQERVNHRIDKVLPESAKKLASAYERLRSNNPEDWSGAVHTCRRVIQELADTLYPPQSTPIKTKIDGKEVPIKVTAENYVNRLVQFIQSRSKSNSYKQIVGSHLKYLGDRLDSIVNASNKGTHTNVSQEEADRYVVFTYLLIGDILSLSEETADRTTPLETEENSQQTTNLEAGPQPGD